MTTKLLEKVFGYYLGMLSKFGLTKKKKKNTIRSPCKDLTESSLGFVCFM